MLHSHNLLVQIGDICNDWWQILDDQFTRAIYLREFLLQAFEVISTVAANINQQRGIAAFISLQQDIFYIAIIEPINPGQALGSHEIVKISHHLGMGHEPGEQVQIGVERALEASTPGFLEVRLDEILREMQTTSCRLIIPMAISVLNWRLITEGKHT